jgi:hypothetical protein
LLTCQILVLVKKNVKRPVEKTWDSITNWLVKAFALDLEHQCLSVMALINRSEYVLGAHAPSRDSTMKEFYQKCMPRCFARDFVSLEGWVYQKCMRKPRMCTRGKVMKKLHNMYVDRAGRDATERWFCMVEWEKREGKSEEEEKK